MDEIMDKALREVLSKRDNVNQIVKLSDIKIRNCDITDEIIDGIKELDYRTLTKEQSHTLTEVVKETLRQVRTLNEDKELALVYDINGYKNQYDEWLFRETARSATDYIRLGSNADVYHIIRCSNFERAVVISHNHPNNRIISLIDLESIIENNNIKIIVAVTNTGKISYVIKDNFDYNQIKQLLKSTYDAIKFSGNEEEYMDTILVSFLAQCEKFGLYFFREA